MQITKIPEDSLFYVSTIYTPGKKTCVCEREQIKIQFHLYQIDAIISGRMLEIYWYSHNSLVNLYGPIDKKYSHESNAHYF